MATKQELEAKIEDLESDVKVLMSVLRGIREDAESVDFSPSPKLEVAPAYLLGKIESASKFVLLLKSISFEDYYNFITAEKVSA